MRSWVGSIGQVPLRSAGTLGWGGGKISSEWAASSLTLNYTVAVSNSFVVLAIGCGSSVHNAGCTASTPQSCTRVFSANDGTMNSYGAVCTNVAAGSYSASAAYTGTGEYAMVAYVYH